MAMLCALDWRCFLVTPTLTEDPDGYVRVRLGHGADELVLHLTRESLDALTLAGLKFPRKGAPPWDLVDLASF
jgi:hypothetical protein